MVPRPSGESWGRGEVDVLIAELMAAGGDDVSEPEAALERVRGGGLTDGEVEAVRARAVEATGGADWGDYLDRIGAVVTGPATAREVMCARRAADREGWRQVLEALGAGEG